MVLVLVGVMAGAIGLTLGGGGQGAAAEREARVLAARLTRAADEALLTGSPMAVIWTEAEYRLLRLDGIDWVAFDVPLLADAYTLPRGLRLQASGDTQSPFTVDASLMPVSGTSLQLALLGDGGDAARVIFDGVTARLDAPL